MSGIHAFMKRDWFTCDQCENLAFHGIHPYCEHNKRYIHWQLKQYGCGQFAENDKEWEKREWRRRHDRLTEKDKRQIAEENHEALLRQIAVLGGKVDD